MLNRNPPPPANHHQRQTDICVRFYVNYVEGGSNTPERELIPYSRDGVVGIYDTVMGEIVKNDKAILLRHPPTLKLRRTGGRLRMNKAGEIRRLSSVAAARREGGMMI